VSTAFDCGYSSLRIPKEEKDYFKMIIFSMLRTMDLQAAEIDFGI
jgi:hypothetical protein